jgi:SH3 domain
VILVLELATALYNYEASSGNEVSFLMYDLMEVLKKDESGWWEVKVEGDRIGWAPANYIVGCVCCSPALFAFPAVCCCACLSCDSHPTALCSLCRVRFPKAEQSCSVFFSEVGPR